jgi:ATP-binding cassette subfamily F protein 3
VLALKQSNVLLLDEVSNHLDVNTIDVLTDAFRAFDGTIIAITHSRAFATALEPTHILQVGHHI